MPQRASMNWRTTFQFQSANSMPTSRGATWTATFSPAWTSVSRAGGTTGLLKGQGGRAAVAEGVQPGSNGMRVALQSLGHGSSGGTAGQQPKGMPAFAFAGGGRPVHALAHLAQVQLPVRQQGHRLVHRSASPEHGRL